MTTPNDTSSDARACSPANTPILAVLILAVPEVTSAAQFYQTAFGWPVLVHERNYIEFSLPNALRFGLYRYEGFALHTLQHPSPPATGKLNTTELYIYVEDIEATTSKLLAAGARSLAPVQAKDWGDDVAYFSDPFGNVVAIARLRTQSH